MDSPWGSISAKKSTSTLDGNWPKLVGRRTTTGSRHMLCLGMRAMGIGSQQGQNKGSHRASAAIWGRSANPTTPRSGEMRAAAILSRSIFSMPWEKSLLCGSKASAPYNGQRFASCRTATFTNWLCLNFFFSFRSVE